MCTSVRQVEECTNSFRRENKMYTCGSMANSQRTPAEINKINAIVKVSVLVEQVMLQCI